MLGANAPAPTASAKMETLRIVVRCSLRLLWVISGYAHAGFVTLQGGECLSRSRRNSKHAGGGQKRLEEP